MADSKGNMIVIVDDDLTSLRCIERLVKRLGFESKAFFLSTDAKEFLLGEGREDVWVLITDVQMPKISGVELTREVKEKTDIRIICISGIPAFEKDCKQAGCDFFFEKPLDFNKFSEVIYSLS